MGAFEEHATTINCVPCPPPPVSRGQNPHSWGSIGRRDGKGQDLSSTNGHSWRGMPSTTPYTVHTHARTKEDDSTPCRRHAPHETHEQNFRRAVAIATTLTHRHKPTQCPSLEDVTTGRLGYRETTCVLDDTRRSGALRRGSNWPKAL